MTDMTHDSNTGRSDSPPERPRSEPEIIPPGRDRSHAGRGDGYVWISTGGQGGTHRIYVARPGPFSIIVALLLAGLVLAAIVLLVLGFALFLIPAVVFVIAALLVAGYARHYWARLKFWAKNRTPR
jgi:hypothetical protein